MSFRDPFFGLEHPSISIQVGDCFAKPVLSVAEGTARNDDPDGVCILILERYGVSGLEGRLHQIHRFRPSGFHLLVTSLILDFLVLENNAYPVGGDFADRYFDKGPRAMVRVLPGELQSLVRLDL